MNILTFDIEEWYIEKMYFGDRSSQYILYDSYLNSILDCLDETGTKATFFCVGGMAETNADVIKKIANRGHEIGCHSNTHQWLTSFSPKQLKEDTYRAISSLENLIGRKVVSYRAPAFSIGDGNKYAIEVLVENGIIYDSSFFPASREFGGCASFRCEVPATVRCNGAQIKEFPICTVKILGRQVAYSGGGYFRFFPLSYVKKVMEDSEYAISYFHIADVVSMFKEVLPVDLYEVYYKEPGTYKNRIRRLIKQNLGINGAFDKMCRLIRDIEFKNVVEAGSIIDWSKYPDIDV